MLLETQNIRIDQKNVYNNLNINCAKTFLVLGSMTIALGMTHLSIEIQ